MPDDTPIRDTVYFYKFNNYYNRIIKRYDTIVEYGDYIAKQENCNFVHGDGINSSFTFNKGVNVNDTPDYVIVSDYKGNLSRWFVTNSFKNRDRQDSLTLRRDLIADYYDDIVKSSPCLIRKGYTENTNPLIFNDEGVKYNKKKQQEILIKDNSNCSYIIGFMSNNAFPSGATINGTITEDIYDYSYASLADFPFKNYVEGAGNNHSQVARYVVNPRSHIYYACRYSVKNNRMPSSYANFEMTANYWGISKPAGYTNTYNSYTRVDDYLYFHKTSTRDSDCEIDYSVVQDTQLYQSVGNSYRNLMISWNTFNSDLLLNKSLSLLGCDEINYYNLKDLDGKKIKLGNVIYNISIEYENTQQRNVNANTSVRDQLNANKPFSSAVETMSAYDTEYNSTYHNFKTTDINVIAITDDYYLRLTQAQTSIKTTVDSPSNRTHLRKYPYDMFMLINESGVNYKVGTYNYVSEHDVNMNIAQAIGEALGSTASYDIQIVPFNPIPDTILADGTINFVNFDYKEIKNANNDIVGHYVMCSSADIKLLLDKDELKINPSNYKKDLNTKEYRLCSPNQETVFDFSPAMNDGIDTWEVTANYRPYASYIKVQPTWKGLYGESFYNGLTDFRGLVYNSTLCVTQLNNNWSTYVANNKNYQQLFDNQINTLTKTQDIQLGAMEETLGLRSFTGMPISSILRVIGGSKDIDMQRELNNVAISKMKTDFNYQMDNIKSMPHTIKKLTNINGDTRIFPYIEISTCTPTEETSFERKMEFTGYTIMTTDYIDNYLKPSNYHNEILEDGYTFIQADLIQLILRRTEESADNHMAVEIANELDKGVYIKKEE